jgi:hypothetical protein
MNFLKKDLGQTYSFKNANLKDDTHVCTNAVHVSAITYGIWLIASQLANRARLHISSNVSGNMRYPIFSNLPDKYELLIADLYYVSIEENFLLPQHQADLDKVQINL